MLLIGGRFSFAQNNSVNFVIQQWTTLVSVKHSWQVIAQSVAWKVCLDFFPSFAQEENNGFSFF